MASSTHYYDFLDWEKAFKMWKDCNFPLNGEYQLVICTRPHASGYWVEPKGTDVGRSDKVYVGDEVLALEQRIIAEHALAEKEGRSPKLTF